jgi:hypothetical protein
MDPGLMFAKNTLEHLVKKNRQDPAEQADPRKRLSGVQPSKIADRVAEEEGFEPPSESPR